MSSVDDFTSRIGEFPTRIRRTRWPWQTLRRNRSAESLGKVTTSDDDSSLPDDLSETFTVTDPDDKAGYCIGGIFGLDVGGTLAKLVYFEEAKNCSNQDDSNYEHVGRHGRHHSLSGETLSEVDLQYLHALAPESTRRKSNNFVPKQKLFPRFP